VSENHADPGSWLIALPISMALLVEDPNYYIQSKFLVFLPLLFQGGGHRRVSKLDGSYNIIIMALHFNS
jgi:hypothetical protein